MTLKDEEIVELFFDVTRLNRHFSQTRYGNMNPFRGQYYCLSVLDYVDIINQKDLAKLLHIRPTSLSELLSKLEQKGFVNRVTSDTDKRISLVSLTNDGKHKAEEVRKKRAIAHKDMLSYLTSEEKEVFYSALQKIQKFYISMEGKNE
ncbi:putative transcription regulator [Clostridium bornimense]|uniref:Putative transcription regulator n=1 Tax=Clostridium bornimense TaxID=1216932 RepID=W6SD52_9CLOT|nr:MarR family transcriptional regulator [Clostridium bornimense]CDM67560.1 putative transcription regulator [Clostridium bornimense]